MFFFVDQKTGWAVSWLGKILKTTDGGDNWRFQISGTTNWLTSLYFTDRYNGWIVGRQGTILHTKDGGGITTDLQNEDYQLPIAFSLSQNYPNPFNPSTTIKYQIPDLPAGRQELSFVTLKVYDVLGKEVATLVNEEKPAGKYEVEFRIAVIYELSSGIYFYQLRAGNFVETKKMVLLK